MVSIIVTVYNVKEYISRCIESILRQNYEDYELVLVDDGSTDGSGEICDYYAKFDRRISVVHKNNAGLVSARKTGITRANGEYIFYVDGDDWIEENVLEKMYNTFSKSDADVLCVNHVMDFEGMTKSISNKIAPGLYSTTEIASSLLLSITPFLWSKLFRREILLPYQMAIDDRIVASEDAVVVYPLLADCKKVMVSDICGYHYVQRTDSMMNTVNKNEIKYCDLVLRYLVDHFKVSNATEQLRIYKELLYDIRVPYTSGLLDGLKKEDKVIIYGAGNFGKAIYRTIVNDNAASVIAWLDKDYEYMQNIGLEVNNPDEFDFEKNEYNCVIIAISNYEIAEEVEIYLKKRGAKKICRKL